MDDLMTLLSLLWLGTGVLAFVCLLEKVIDRADEYASKKQFEDFAKKIEEFRNEFK